MAVEGIAYPTQPPTVWLAPPDQPAPGASRIAVWSRVDLDRIRRQVKEPLLPISIAELARPGQRSDRFPQPVAGAPTDEGPHASYAAQWFSFALITSAGYALGIWRVARAGHTLPPNVHS